MNFSQTLFEVIDTRSFSSLWYWIVLAAVWSSVSHWVLGVPFDMIVRARRHGGQAVDDLEEIVRINITRMLYIAEVSGIWLIGFTMFFHTALLILAFWYWIEFAQALELIVLPLTLVALLSLRAARRIAAEGQGGEVLLKRLMRHRLATQIVGMIAIFVTAMFGMYQNLAVPPTW